MTESQQKPVLIDMWATWCKNCLTMDQTTLRDPAEIAALSGYVKIKFQADDTDAEPAKSVMRRFDAVFLPTYVILRPKNAPTIPIRFMRMMLPLVLLASVVLAQSPAPVVPTDQSVSPVETGVLPKGFRPAGPDCLVVPDWEIHEYNPNFFILRESGCINYEKPFLYLIFGRDKVLLEDTGAGKVDTATVVNGLIAKWRERNKKTSPLTLMVIHSHGHSDHIAGDSGFKDSPNVQFVAANVAEVSKSAGIRNWPTDIGQIDLGNRVIDVIPIPGHEPSGIALYDRQTGLLLSGDTLYPGRLYVSTASFAEFAASIQRLVDFTKNKPVAHILGTHVEQTRTPFVDYPRGTVYQPDEHALELSRGDLLELNEALIAMKDKPVRLSLRSVIFYLR